MRLFSASIPLLAGRWGGITNAPTVMVASFLLATGAILSMVGNNNDPLFFRRGTAEAKAVLEDTVSQWHSTFPERIVPFNAQKPEKEIRFAAFGSSMTWGATLNDREKDAYVKKLSIDKGTNYGIRSSGPNYPAACTHSMLGEEEYDVFILEFFTVANTGMMELAKRLRERFPDAIIVIARLWDPPMLQNKDGEGLRSWAHKKGFGSEFIHKDEFKEMFLREYDENKWNWQFLTTQSWFVDVHEEIARETGAYIVPMAWAEHAAGPSGYLEIGDKHLGPDSFHLSKFGHEDFAQRVKALVDRVGVPKQLHIGQFASTDYCLNWFQTGVIGEGLTYSDNAVVGKMPNTEKYAMTFEGKDTPGWIEMTNPSDEIMYIFVAYMSSGPPPSKYPKTNAVREDEDETKVILDPVATWGADQKMKVHVSRLALLGEVQPHKTAKISFRPLEETEWPFRIVQVVLTGKADFGTSFGAMPDSGRLRGTIDA